jgi:hypothetical protein
MAQLTWPCFGETLGNATGRSKDVLEGVGERRRRKKKHYDNNRFLQHNCNNIINTHRHRYYWWILIHVVCNRPMQAPRKTCRIWRIWSPPPSPTCQSAAGSWSDWSARQGRGYLHNTQYDVRENDQCGWPVTSQPGKGAIIYTASTEFKGCIEALWMTCSSKQWRYYLHNSNQTL